jgi:CheY-like chemotaxis protein
MKEGPIILIEDDLDDQEIFTDAVAELGVPNELRIFNNCIDAFNYLLETTDQPFIIFCDVNLPLLNGIEFKKKIDSNDYLRRKSIPFVFYSTTVNQQAVNEAYTKLTIQGFFRKKESFSDIKSNIKTILEYWKECSHPNTF